MLKIDILQRFFSVKFKCLCQGQDSTKQTVPLVYVQFLLNMFVFMDVCVGEEENIYQVIEGRQR